MKDVVIVDKGKREEATKVLQDIGLTVYGPMRFRWDWNTAFVACAATVVIVFILLGILK